MNEVIKEEDSTGNPSSIAVSDGFHSDSVPEPFEGVAPPVYRFISRVRSGKLSSQLSDGAVPSEAIARWQRFREAECGRMNCWQEFYLRPVISLDRPPLKAGHCRLDIGVRSEIKRSKLVPRDLSPLEGPDKSFVLKRQELVEVFESGSDIDYSALAQITFPEDFPKEILDNIASFNGELILIGSAARFGDDEPFLYVGGVHCVYGTSVVVRDIGYIRPLSIQGDSNDLVLRLEHLFGSRNVGLSGDYSDARVYSGKKLRRVWRDHPRLRVVPEELAKYLPGFPAISRKTDIVPYQRSDVFPLHNYMASGPAQKSTDSGNLRAKLDTVLDEPVARERDLVPLEV